MPALPQSHRLAQGTGRRSRVQGGRLWATPGHTTDVPQAPKLGGNGLVVGRLFSPPPSQALVIVGTSNPQHTSSSSVPT